MSTIPAVLARLTALGVAVTAGFQGINGPLGSVTTTLGKLVVVGDGDIVGRRELNSMASGTTSEEYTVPVVVTADVLSAADQQVADDLALDAWAALELAIREYPGGADLGLFGEGVISALPTGEFALMRRADDNGRHAAVRFGVAVRAQNT